MDMTFPLEGPQSKGWSSVQGSLQKTSPILLEQKPVNSVVLLLCE